MSIIFLAIEQINSICRSIKKMTNYQSRRARLRQRIRDRVAEVRGIPLSEVQYP